MAVPVLFSPNTDPTSTGTKKYRGTTHLSPMGYAYPTNIFKCLSDEYNFSIISNLFHNNNLYALSMHKSKMREQNASYLIKNSELETKTGILS